METSNGSTPHACCGPITLNEIKTILLHKKPPEKIGRRNSISETQPSRMVYGEKQKRIFGDPSEEVNVSFTSEYFTPNETAQSEKLNKEDGKNVDDQSAIRNKIDDNVEDCSMNNKVTESMETIIDKISKVLDLSSRTNSVYTSAGECSNCTSPVSNIFKEMIETNKNENVGSCKETSLLIVSDDDLDDNEVEESKLNNTTISDYIDNDDDVIVISDDDGGSLHEDVIELKDEIQSENSLEIRTKDDEIEMYESPGALLQQSLEEQASCSFIYKETPHNLTGNESCNCFPGLMLSSENVHYDNYSSQYTDDSMTNSNHNFSDCLQQTDDRDSNRNLETNSKLSLAQTSVNEINNLYINKADLKSGDNSHSQNDVSCNDASIDLRLNFTELLHRSITEGTTDPDLNISQSLRRSINESLNKTNENHGNNTLNNLFHVHSEEYLGANLNYDDGEQQLVNEDNSDEGSSYASIVQESQKLNSSQSFKNSAEDPSVVVLDNSHTEWNDTIEEMEKFLQAHALNNASTHTLDTTDLELDISNKSDSRVIPKKSFIPIKNYIPSSKATVVKPPYLTKPCKPDNFKIPTKIATINKKPPSYKNVLSPVSVYIKNSPKAPLLQKVPAKTLPKTALFPAATSTKTSNKENEIQLPTCVYKPAKRAVTSEKKQLKLPSNVQKHIPHVPNIIRHQGRVGEKKSSQNVEARLLNEDLTFCDANITATAEAEVSIRLAKKAYIK